LESSAVGGIEAGFADGDVGFLVRAHINGAPVGAPPHLQFRPEIGSGNYENLHGL